MRSIRVKLVFWICVLFIVIGALIYIPLSVILPRKITSQILRRDLEIVQQLSRETKNLLLLNDKIALPLFLHDNLDRLEDAQYLFVQGSDGKIIAHTFGEGFPEGLLSFNPAQKENKIRGFLNNGRKMYDIAVPVLDGSVGVLHLGVSLESGKKDIAEITRINDYVLLVILFGLGIGVIVFLIIGLLFSNQIIKLKMFAASIGKGNLDAKIDIKSKDEIGVLADELNEMAMNLKDQLQEIKRLHIIEERNRIAFDLHDGCAQDMASMIKRIELSKKLFDIDPQEAFKELDALRENAKDVLGRTRQVILDLKSPEDAEFDLLGRIDEHICNYQKQNGINIKLRVSDPKIKILPEKAKNIFFILKEALNNVRKHSLAKNVVLDLDSGNNNHLVIDIRDDGKGFNVDSVLSTSVRDGKLGLLSMQQRANSLNGTVTINSAPERGTHVLINIPLKEVTKETYYEI